MVAEDIEHYSSQIDEYIENRIRLERLYEQGYHEDKNGNRVLLSEMSDSYLKNCIVYFSGTFREKYFLTEAQRRSENHVVYMDEILFLTDEQRENLKNKNIVILKRRGRL
jgi:hypothetical protein